MCVLLSSKTCTLFLLHLWSSPTGTWRCGLTAKRHFRPFSENQTPLLIVFRAVQAPLLNVFRTVQAFALWFSIRCSVRATSTTSGSRNTPLKPSTRIKATWLQHLSLSSNSYAPFNQKVRVVFSLSSKPSGFNGVCLF